MSGKTKAKLKKAVADVLKTGWTSIMAGDPGEYNLDQDVLFGECVIAISDTSFEVEADGVEFLVKISLPQKRGK